MLDRWVSTKESKAAVAVAQNFAEFNSFAHLIRYHVSESLADKHLVGSIFLGPPKSPFTPPQRVMAVFFLLCGVVFTNAFFYKRGETRAPEQVTPSHAAARHLVAVCST